MSTQTPVRSKSDAPTSSATDPRPSTLYVGTDTSGCTHFFHTRTHAVTVVTPHGTREWRQSLGVNGIDAWIRHIRASRGWADQQLYTTPARALLANVASETRDR